MRIHITLVGAQPAPVYHGIVATHPDKIVYIYSEEKQSQRVLSVLRTEINIPEDPYPALDPIAPQAIMGRAKELAEKYKTDEITLNISSGLKSWSHIFGMVFQPLPNAHVIYFDQNNILWDYHDMQSYDNYKFDMDILLRLYGNSLIKYRKYEDYTPSDRNTVKQIESVLNYARKQFNDLTTVLAKEWDNQLIQQKSGIFALQKEGSYVEWEKGKFARLVLNHKKHGIRETFLNSPHAVELLFHTGWFEYKVADILNGWRYAQEIRLNCIFPPKSDKTNNRYLYPKNEIDIIVNAGRKLLFVECKTKVHSSNDIDKFKNAVKNYGGTASKALFVTDTPMDLRQIEKCQDSNITTFCLEGGKSAKIQELYSILDNMILTINA